MDTLTLLMVICLVPIICAVLLLALAGIAASMLSSKISQELGEY